MAGCICEAFGISEPEKQDNLPASKTEEVGGRGIKQLATSLHLYFESDQPSRV